MAEWNYAAKAPKKSWDEVHLTLVPQGDAAILRKG